jgi:hypothetical protein
MGHLAVMIKQLLLPSLTSLLILVASPASSAIDAGEIGKIKGSGVLERDGSVIDGDTGIGVQSMDTAVTARGSMQIDFIDDTRVDITEHSRLLIDEFVYDPAAGKASLGLKASMGTVRYASGQIAKNFRQNVKIRTPSATIGVRGTDFIMVVDEVGGSMITLLPSCDVEGYCYTGEITVETDAGFVIMNQAFQTTMATISSQPPSKPLILDLDENQINQLLIIRKKRPYDEEEDELRLKARKMFDFLGIDFLEIEEFGDELADSIEGIWNTQLSDTAGYLGELLHDMIDQLNLALMALFKDELDRQNAEFFRVRQTGLDPNTGIFYDEEGDNHLLSREHKPTDDFFQLRLNMDQSYVINMAQGGWYYYDYRLGVGNSNSIDINQSNY